VCAVERCAVFDEISKRSKVPVLFHYAENDHFFARRPRALVQRFTAGGAGGVRAAPAPAETVSLSWRGLRRA
jgi:dienelactone hydrolase